MTKCKRYVSLVCAACLLLSLLLLPGCKADPQPTQPTETQPSTQPTAAAKAEHVIAVKNEGGLGIEGIGIYVYTDETKTELVWFDKTGADGTIRFTEIPAEGMIAVLNGVPAEYLSEEQYPLTGQQTEIVLSASSLNEDNMQNIRYQLGDTMLDFSVTTPDGTVYTLSELLKQKKAVVLNFWFSSCNPCVAEFPHMEEAYQQHKDKLEILALNPVDGSDEMIAQFRQEHGISFPMAQCDPAWAQMMQLTGYPTTVVIDRSGNISLIHTGSIPDAKVFSDAFTFFTADDYVPALVEDIHSLALPEVVQGTEDNPLVFGGVNKFEVTVQPGQTVYCDVYKVSGMYMQISERDVSATYAEKTYTTEKGKISVRVESPDTYTPVRLAIRNDGAQEKTILVKFVFARGTQGNPYALELGEFTTKVSSGNDQGVYYQYKATEDGTLTIRNLSATADYGYVLYNLNSYAYRTLEADGSVDPETGLATLSVPMKKGQRVQLIINTLPDKSHNYPSGTIRSFAEFTAGGDTGEEEKTQPVDYTVTVTDDRGNTLAGVFLLITGQDVSQTVSTGSQGAVTVKLVPGSYTVSVTLPAGYTAETTDYALTETETSVTICLTEQVISMADYSVTVLDPAGQPVANAMVLIGETMVYTNEAGVAAANLEVGAYTVYVSGFAADLATEAANYTLAAEQTAVTVKLVYKPGTENNPIQVSGSFTTERISAGSKVHYRLTGAAGKLLTIADADVYVICNFVTYEPDGNGVLELTVPEGDSADLAIGNKGSARESYDVTVAEPTEPTEPSTEATEPSTEATEPSTEATEPSTEATEPSTEATEPSTEATEPSTEATEPSTEATEPSTEATEPSTEATEPSTEVTEPSTEVTEPSTEPAPDYGVYTVTVTDYSGTPIESVMVLMKDSANALVASGMTDAQGVFTSELDYADYTVTLNFSATGIGYFYETSAGKLSATVTELTILAAAPLSGDTGDAYVTDSGLAYLVPVGGSLVNLGSSHEGYITENRLNLFMFIPTQSGIYRFTTSNSKAKISYWGGNSSYITEQSDVVQEDNSFTLDIYDANLGGVWFIGVKGSTRVKQTALVITRVADVGFNPSLAPWEEYKGTETPKSFGYTGGEVAYVDLTGKTADYTLVYNPADGCYHLGTADGPKMMVNLGKGAPYISMDKMVNGEGAIGGTAFRAAYYDAQGNYIKEDYTVLMKNYVSCADAATGYYPLTKQLAYVLQMGTEFQGWNDKTHPSFLVRDEEGNPDPTINETLVWMFACCYELP